MNNSTITLRKIRDFGSNISVSIEFLRENILPFYKSLAFIAGPFILISSILSGIFLSEFMSEIMDRSANPGTFGSSIFPENFSKYMLNSVLIQFIGMIAVITVTYRYLLLYPEYGKNITFEILWKYVKKDFLPIIAGNLVFLLIVAGSTMILGSSFLAIGFLSGGWVLGLLVFLAFIYLMIPCSFIYIIQLAENVNPFVAVQRAFYLIRGYWFSTLGILVISTIIIYMINLVFSIPLSVISVVTTVNTLDPTAAFSSPYFSVLNIASTVMSSLGIFFALPVFYLSLGFQYFSIVENKEHVGLIERIELIGTKEEDIY